MKTSLALASTLATAALGAIEPKNFIFVIPDGLAPASVTLARTYLSMVEGGSTPGAPGTMSKIAIDMTPVGNTLTHSSNNLVTDSAAAGTALATGFKTENGRIGTLPDDRSVGTILEAAKLRGYKTALVVTSIINHATPAAFSSHIRNRNDLAGIAGQQVGYSHPLGQSVDILLGGGRCYFKPRSEQGSCRSDDVDLFGFAEEKGYYVAQNRSQFDALEGGLGDVRLPYIGLFNDGDLVYEVDRREQNEDVREPSLTEMSEAALNSLHRATHCKDKGYFIMIEASRIDHASHAHDANAHLGDVLQYNSVIDLVTKWIEEHPDTAMISVADHETGGITLPSGYDPRRLQQSRYSTEHWADVWSDYEGSDEGRRALLVEDILPTYGVKDASSSEVDAILSGSISSGLAELLSKRVGVKWSTGGHSAVDTTLYAYAAGDMGEQLKADLAGTWDNIEIPRYLEKAMNVSLDEVTALLAEAEAED